MHAVAVVNLSDATGETWGIGIWLGFAGLFTVLLGCAVGTRTERGPAPAYGLGYYR